MIDLYEKVNDIVGIHDIIDSIDIWLYEKINDDIAKYLQIKITKNNDLNKVYSSWLPRADESN